MHQKDKRKVWEQGQKNVPKTSPGNGPEAAHCQTIYILHTQIRDRKAFICAETLRQRESREKGEWEDNWRFADLGHILLHSHILVSCITYVYVLECFFCSLLFQVTLHNVKHSSRELLTMSSGYCDDEWMPC